MEKYIHYSNSYKSADKIHKINYQIYFPKGDVKGIVQIAHGMCEYFGRYEKFCCYLASKGFVVCGNDHLGHGLSVNDKSEYGWFGDSQGWQYAVMDMYTLTKIVKNMFHQKPFFLLGHSMGSFLARAYTTKFGNYIDGVIFAGTSGGVNNTELMLAFIDLLEKIHGDKYRSSLIDKLAFGAYNVKIKDKKTKYDWISRDEEIVRKYCGDEKCTFIFTLNGFENLLKVLWFVSQDKWYKTYPKNLPTYLLSGSDDPVGNYARGAKKVFDKLAASGANVKLRIYNGARHELINETNYSQIWEDIYNFLQEQINKERSCDTDVFMY